MSEVDLAAELQLDELTCTAEAVTSNRLDGFYDVLTGKICRS